MNKITNNVVFIFLDDVRLPPSLHWKIARTAEKAYTLIRQAYDDGYEIVISLDHDLGENVSPDGIKAVAHTGYDLLSWLEKDIFTEASFKPSISFQIHSANPVGCSNMERAIKAIEKRLL